MPSAECIRTDAWRLGIVGTITALSAVIVAANRRRRSALPTGMSDAPRMGGNLRSGAGA